MTIDLGLHPSKGSKIGSRVPLAKSKNCLHSLHPPMQIIRVSYFLARFCALSHPC